MHSISYLVIAATAPVASHSLGRLLTPFPLTADQDWPSTTELRWQLAGFAIGVAILSLGFAALFFYLFRRTARDRSLLFFSLFTVLYAVRLIFRQPFLHSVVNAPASFWNYSDLLVNNFIDNFIVVPLTLFLVEVLPGRWKGLNRWLLIFQIGFATVRFFANFLHVGRHPVEVAYHYVILGYCGLLICYPFSFQRGQRMPKELKIIYAGLAVFGLFVVQNNLGDLRGVHGRNFEPMGFLVLAGCLAYLAASHTYSNEQRLLSLQKELEIARQIQSSILPRGVPRVAGLDIAARYVPMAAVAGDFYDFHAVDEKRVGILVADVTGHGVPAALIASMLKTALAAQSAVASDPARVLAGLNLSLCGKFEEHFVTAGYLFLDAEKHLLRYAGAGHPPLMLGAGNGRQPAFREIDCNGLLLGVSEDATYQSLELSFRPGDRCLLYTDGVPEAKNGTKEEFGSSRLLQFLKARSQLAAAPLITALLAELAHWSGKGDGASQEDDITLIAVNFDGTPP